MFLATRSVTVTRNLILLADDTVDTVSLTLYGDWDLVTESDWLLWSLCDPSGPRDQETTESQTSGHFFWISSFSGRKKRKIRTWNKKNESCRTTGTVWYRKPGTEKLYPLGPYPSFIQTLSCSHVLCSKPRSYHRGVGCGTKGDLTLSGRIHQVLTFGVPTFGLWGSCVISAMVLVRNHSEIFLEP